MVTFNYKGFRTEVKFKKDTVGGNIELENGDYIPFMGNTIKEAFEEYVIEIDIYYGDSFDCAMKKNLVNGNPIDLSMYLTKLHN